MAKTLSFMVMHFVVAFTVIYLMTGSLLIGGAVALVEPMINSVAYHFHEKLWDRKRARQLSEEVIVNDEVYAV
ncbi:MAG: hypothetical protein COC05_03355 [Gammaproteobacteria bacterium]|nr:MAG: hypothetical protein COC05_03355 [Gammaproteobacteria bacterium]